MKEIANKEIKLSDFPPSLRKLANYLIENDDNDPLCKICDKLGLNYDSILTLKTRYKNKYNKDFDLMLHEYRMEPLKRNSLKVYKSLVLEAMSGRLGHQKLFSEILGDYKSQVSVDHRVIGLFAVVGGSSSQMPADIAEYRKRIKPDGQQIIDVEYED